MTRQDLEERLADLLERWDLTPGETYGEGFRGLVVAVKSATGVPLVLKVDRPGSPFDAQVSTMCAAQGRGYAAVVAADLDRGGLLLERLGPSLASSALDPPAQVTALTTTLLRAWEVPREVGPPVLEGHDKAAQLARMVDEGRTQADGIRWGPALDLAHALAAHLSATRDAARDVLCHGDPHPGNAVRAGGSSGAARYKLVDPDGFRCEPEYDLGVVLRDFTPALLADRPSATSRHDGWCRLAATMTGLDGERVRMWAFVERVTSALALRAVGEVATAEAFLSAAMVLRP
ncbi:aminoglycoside phosphotransferase family protein [Pedococcus sp.]|uniref:aminoglycoside phosphotransferase family protein n=1 Tax=Pedococcus sp. TaxID=2860345 RepID=UPI002E0E8450|nr:aminoglycoside phosphotransferase family protein [Pedococcus sp.]